MFSVEFEGVRDASFYLRQFVVAPESLWWVFAGDVYVGGVDFDVPALRLPLECVSVDES